MFKKKGADEENSSNYTSAHSPNVSKHDMELTKHLSAEHVSRTSELLEEPVFLRPDSFFFRIYYVT